MGGAPRVIKKIHPYNFEVEMTNWINCYDRMPAPLQSVLLFVQAHAERFREPGYRQIDLCAIGFYQDYEKRWHTTLDSDESLTNLRISHWMPLPEKPSEGINVNM